VEVADDTPQEVKDDNPPIGDTDRVTNYVASGGKIVDLSNKPRKDNDGFLSDHELMTPFNQAHTGTKVGLSRLAKVDRI